MKRILSIVIALSLAWRMAAQDAPQLILPILDRFDMKGVYFLPQRNLLATHGSDDNVKIWRLSDGKLLHTIVLKEYENPNGMAISPNGKTLAFVTYGKVHWVNLDDFSMKESDFISEEDGMQQYEYRSCVFSKDGNTLYVGGGNYGEIVLWKIPLNGTKLERISKAALLPQELDTRGVEPVKGTKSIHLSADGKSVLAAAGPKEIYQFNLAERKSRRLTSMEANYLVALPKGQWVTVTKAGGKSTVRVFSVALQAGATASVPYEAKGAVAFPKSNKCLIFGEKQYSIFDATTAKIEGTYPLPDGVQCMAVNERENQIAHAGIKDERARAGVRALRASEDLLALGFPLFQADRLAASPAADWFLVAKGNEGNFKTLHVSQGNLQVRTHPPIDLYKSAQLSAGHVGAILEHNGKLQVFNSLKNQEPLRIITEQQAEYGISLSPDGKLAALLTAKNGALIFEIESKKQIAHLQYKPGSVDENPMLYGTFSPDGKTFVGACGAYDVVSRLRCWDLASGKMLWEIKESPFEHPTFSPDGKEIFCLENDPYERSVRWLDPANGRTLRQVSMTNELKYVKRRNILLSPDFSTFLDPSERTLYSTKTGKKVHTYVPNGVAYGAALLGNGYYAWFAITSSADEDNLSSRLILYDFSKQKELATLYLLEDSDDWALITPQGHYDATPGAMQKMYYRQGTDLIALDALSERFFTPRLYEKLLNDYRPPSDDDIKRLKKPPVVKLGIPVEQRNLVVEDDKTNIPQYVIRTEHIKITAEATAPGDVVKDIRLYQNGKLVETTTRNLVVEDDAGTPSKSVVFEIALVPGDNRLRAIAPNSKRVESAPDEILIQYKPGAETNPPTPSNIQLHMVVVGINKYKNAKYNLNYAIADATAFTNALKAGATGLFADIQVHTVADEQATKSGIVAAMDRVKAQAKPQDVFVFYYAGHGVLDDKNQYYLVPHDVTQLYGNPDALAQQGLSATLLQQYAREIKAQKQLFLLDACQSAGALQQTATARGAAEEKAISQLARATGTHWITASGSEQFASEFAQLGHGTFTYALLEALAGKADNGDKRITVKEIDAYLQAVVPELTAKYKGTPQYPASFGFGNDFPVGVVR